METVVNNLENKIAKLLNKECYFMAIASTNTCKAIKNHYTTEASKLKFRREVLTETLELVKENTK